MIPVSIHHHDPHASSSLVAEVYYVDPAGQVEHIPIQRAVIAPGVSAVLHIRPGNVITVREQPPAEPARAANGLD